jgi:hypothetical protein
VVLAAVIRATLATLAILMVETSWTAAAEVVDERVVRTSDEETVRSAKEKRWKKKTAWSCRLTEDKASSLAFQKSQYTERPLDPA